MHRILGGRLTTNHIEMTHLIMTRPARTIKFMYGLCCAKYILKSSWIEESANLGSFQNEENYWITEIMDFKCDVPSVVKAPGKNKLFENRVFFITPSVKPSVNYLRWLIEQCGGKWEQNRRSIGKIHELNNQNPNSYAIISCPEDLHLLNFKHFVCYICTSELIMVSIMTQQIDFIRSELQQSLR